MYIDKENQKQKIKKSLNTQELPESPETPNWGPPAGNNPGETPESPETPNWGPPAGNNPGWTPESPETPNWRPPIGGDMVMPPVIIGPNRPVRPVRPQSGTCNVRFLYAAVDNPAVDIRMDGQVVIRRLQFSNSTPYYLTSASRNKEIVVINSNTGVVLFRSSFTFQSGRAYTVSIINSNNRISLASLEDIPCSNRSAGCVRAANFSPDSGPVDIFLTGAGRTFRRVETNTSTEYVPILRGSYRAFVSEALPCAGNSSIIMRNDYVECNNTRIVIMDSVMLNIMNGVSYTLYIIGRANNYPSLQILPLESDLIY